MNQKTNENIFVFLPYLQKPLKSGWNKRYLHLKTNSMLFIFFILIWPLLEARTEIKEYFRCFLVQMKGLELAFEINWPLGTYDLHLLIILKLKIKPCGLGSTSNSRCGGILIQNRNQNNYFVPLCLMVGFTDFIKRKNQTARNNIFWTYLVSK